MNLAKTLFQAWLPWNTYEYNCNDIIIIISYIQRLSNLLILLHSPVIHHPTAGVSSITIMPFSFWASKLISEILKQLLSPCFTSSLEWTRKIPPPVCSFSYLAS